jgi:endo-1,4-beta-xylanase
MCCGLTPLVRAQAPDLKSAAKSHGLFWGASVQRKHIERDADFAKLLSRECSVIVPEWEMKWAAIESQRGKSNFAAADAIVAFARRNELKVRGHTLIWHRSIPDWARDAFKEQQGWDAVAAHIGRMLGRYGDDPVIHWDVLNEIVEPKDGRADGLRASPFLAAFGPDYVRRALDAARMHAPGMRLYINEYGLDYDSPVERNRRVALLRLVEALKKAGAPLDGVGIQAHLRLDGSPFSTQALRSFLADLAAHQVKISITELDVRERNFMPPLAERDKAVADEVRRYLDVVLDEPAVEGIVAWGLSDRYSWLTPAKLAATGVRNRGLPYDDALVPKPLKDAIVAALEKRPAR